MTDVVPQIITRIYLIMIIIIIITILLVVLPRGGSSPTNALTIVYYYKTLSWFYIKNGIYNNNKYSKLKGKSHNIHKRKKIEIQ